MILFKPHMKMPVIIKNNTGTMKNLFAFIVLAVSFVFCSKNSESSESFDNIEANIRIYVCSRGCYQFLISVPSSSADTLFFPVNLPDIYKQVSMNNARITITADILSDSTQVNVSSPDDIPVPLLKVKNLNIINIKYRK
jgi:hypothetical protein